jgi:hypothetical protein
MSDTLYFTSIGKGNFQKYICFIFTYRKITVANSSPDVPLESM